MSSLSNSSIYFYPYSFNKGLSKDSNFFLSLSFSAILYYYFSFSLSYLLRSLKILFLSSTLRSLRLIMSFFFYSATGNGGGIGGLYGFKDGAN